LTFWVAFEEALFISDQRRLDFKVMGDTMTKVNCFRILLCVGLGWMVSGCGEQKHGDCVNASEADEDRAWVWIHENAVVAENRKCILCYLDRSDPNDRCYYIYNDDFLQNRTKDTCRQYACSDDPGAGDAWQQGHGGQGMIEEIYASYENEP